MTIQNNQFAAFNDQLNQQIAMSGMTFNPSIDCRNDLVNFYGYTRQQVNAMSDDELFSIMDRIEDQEEGYSEHEETLPVELQNNKCSCGGSLKVLYVDCETRGDCEIYVCECVKCSKEMNFNYAAEWYEYYEEDEPETIAIPEPVKVAEVKEDNRSINDLNLSVRTYNCLFLAGYKIVQQVKDASFDDMMRVRNLGRKSLEEIETILNIKFN